MSIKICSILKTAKVIGWKPFGKTDQTKNKSVKIFCYLNLCILYLKISICGKSIYFDQFNIFYSLFVLFHQDLIRDFEGLMKLMNLVNERCKCHSFCYLSNVKQYHFIILNKTLLSFIIKKMLEYYFKIYNFILNEILTIVNLVPVCHLNFFEHLKTIQLQRNV